MKTFSNLFFPVLIIGSFIALFSCRKYQSNTSFEAQDWLAGGAQTTYNSGSGAFGEMFTNLTPNEINLHELGDKFFEAIFVSSPAPKNPGLGPVFNAVSCASCHVSDGRGKAPEEGENLQSLLIRLSTNGTDEHGGPLAFPEYGGQFQQRAISGSLAEGDVQINYTYTNGSFADGSSFQLRKPHIGFSNLYAGNLDQAMTSARIAPPVFGLGLLEAIPTSSILMNEDINDTNNDGISGKANWVWDIEKKKLVVGRFGWKANNPNLLQQSGGAFNQDMGITSELFPIESSYGQSQYDGSGDEPEIDHLILTAVGFYMQTLKAPAPRNWRDPEVLKGKQLFNDLKCAACHRPQQSTAVNVAFAALSNQRFYPYTDLLLHDMGPELADNRPDFLANGNEWRTPPLWGIGLSEVVNGHSNFLHDGRARSIEEAILWHGGEGLWSRNKYLQLELASRKALLKFLKSL